MSNLGKQLAPDNAVASKFIGHDHARDILKSLQQPSKEALGGFCIPPWLDEDVEHDTVLIHRAPKVVLHALDPDEHLIKVPLVIGPWTAAARAVGQKSGRTFRTGAVLADLYPPNRTGNVSKIIDTG